mgnify:CR=1 FL=1
MIIVFYFLLFAVPFCPGADTSGKGKVMKNPFKNSMRWSIFIFILTFVMGCVFSVVSTTILEGVGWGFGVLIVFAIIIIGILFDMMGIASTSANEQPFHAMAAERVKGAKHAIQIVRNADRFSNFCNDVIGDICGIISGAASAIVVIKLFTSATGGEAEGPLYTVVNVMFTALVSGLTVGGKAIGKSLAIHSSTQIILYIGKFFYVLERRFGIKMFQGKKTKGNNGKRGNKHAAGKSQPTE